MPTGNRLKPPCMPGFDTLSTLREILATGHDYSWFVMTQKILKKEVALSGSEQNPGFCGEELDQGDQAAFAQQARQRLRSRHSRAMAKTSLLPVQLGGTGRENESER
jgi:predicted oxidoreductase